MQCWYKIQYPVPVDMLTLLKISDLVFARHGIPAHGDASDWAKCDKSFLDLLLTSVIVDTPHIDPARHTNYALTDDKTRPAHNSNSLLPLEIFGLLLLVCQGLLHKHHLDTHLK